MTEQNINGEIMDKLTKVCLCKGISRASIKKALSNGARTVLEIQKATGAGTGSCQGRRCNPKIEMLLEEYLNNK